MNSTVKHQGPVRELSQLKGVRHPRNRFLNIIYLPFDVYAPCWFFVCKTFFHGKSRVGEKQWIESVSSQSLRQKSNIKIHPLKNNTMLRWLIKAYSTIIRWNRLKKYPLSVKKMYFKTYPVKTKHARKGSALGQARAFQLCSYVGCFCCLRARSLDGSFARW